MLYGDFIEKVLALRTEDVLMNERATRSPRVLGACIFFAVSRSLWPKTDVKLLFLTNVHQALGWHDCSLHYHISQRFLIIGG